MSKQSLSVEVEKEAYDVAFLIAQVVIKLKQKVPLAQIVAGELLDLEKAIGGLGQVSGNYAEDHAAFFKALMLPMSDLASALVAPAPPSA